MDNKSFSLEKNLGNKKFAVVAFAVDFESIFFTLNIVYILPA